MTQDTVRIGCGCGFWGDSAAGPAQLVRNGSIDFLVLDYLSEVTMALLARARRKRPELGYTPDFITSVMAPLAREIAERRIKVVANAGGVNPRSCRDALQAVFDSQGVGLRIAVVSGDDVTEQLPGLRDRGAVDLETGRPLPGAVISANAYLGAFPIARALQAGADVVITGRCADSSLALGPLVARFAWSESDLDQLAQGSLAGHIIECGTQATGGVFTDWGAVADGWDRMGFPIVECEADGSFIVTKPTGTGGLVTRGTVAEQITYEVHDPAAYILPDVVCDFTGVRVEDLGRDRVRVSGARGRPATPHYKASLTYQDGFRCLTTLMVVGREAVARARKVAEAILERTRSLFAERGYPDYSATSVEVLGAEAMYGAHSRASASREVVLKIAVAHPSQEALELFAQEIFPAATSMAQSITGFAGGRPPVQPVVRLASCLVPKADVSPVIELDGRTVELGQRGATVEARPAAAMVVDAAGDDTTAPTADAVARGKAAPVVGTGEGGEVAVAQPLSSGECVEVSLIRLAWARSGDKGDTSNIGVIARRPEFESVIAAAVTPEAVRTWLAHLVDGEVVRYGWPGLQGWNFVLRRALGGGGTASLRYDPQGKSYAQVLLDFPVRVPAEWLEGGGLLGPDAEGELGAESRGRLGASHAAGAVGHADSERAK